MTIKFNDHEQIYEITSIRRRHGIVVIKGEGLPENNTSGFRLIDGDAVVEDYSEYRTKYNVITKKEGVMALSKGMVETKENSAETLLYTPQEKEIAEDVEPLSAEELTEAVADIMYEISAAQLGL